MYLGYRDVKMKVGGASLNENLQRIEAVLRISPKGIALMIDANGHFDLDYAIEFGEKVKDHKLIWYEEVGDPLDYHLQVKLSKHYPHATATGENLFSLQDATNLIRYGGMNPETDFLQFDCALSCPSILQQVWSFMVMKRIQRCLGTFRRICGLLHGAGWLSSTS